jgi:hypothetical protein
MVRREDAVVTHMQERVGMRVAASPALLEGDSSMSNATLDQARAVKAVAIERLAEYGILGVVGIGITRIAESYAVKVNLEKHPASGVELPTSIDGVPVRFEVIGEIRAHEAV